jgi:hypothetical protein
MCLFFKKKKLIKVPDNSKYSIGEFVHFRHRGELTFGWVYRIYLDDNNSVLYDVQVGGQCPAIVKGIKEEIIFIKK